MFIDFATILYFFSVLFLALWVIDAYFFQTAREAHNQKAWLKIKAAEDARQPFSEERKAQLVNKEPLLTDMAKSFFPVLVLVIVLRAFVVEPFRIPSPSMVPTLLTGDFILVNKSAYGINLPVINHRLQMDKQPERGDVVVFRFPEEPYTYYIKRLIGLPGDVILHENNRLTVNGRALAYETSTAYSDIGAGSDYNSYDLIREQVGKVSHNILLNTTKSPHSRLQNSGRYVVPQGQYFVMGDNRHHSSDSRIWGTVPATHLVGRAVAIWMNWDPVQTIRWSRMFTRIR